MATMQDLLGSMTAEQRQKVLDLVAGLTKPATDETEAGEAEAGEAEADKWPSRSLLLDQIPGAQ
jgi:hypothetical protein